MHQATDISEKEKEYCRVNNIPLRGDYAFERLKHMLSFRNRVHLYNAKCDFSGAKMISSVPPESGLKVYDIEVWQSDCWNPLDYGRDYDFNRPFFEQLYDLQRLVPTYNLSVVRDAMENSDYANGVSASKNCYLVFQIQGAEDSLYSISLVRSREAVDSIYVIDSEICYDCEDISGCYDLKYSRHCTNSSNSYFLNNCHSCKDCYGCSNLIQKQYYIYNKQHSKEDYFKFLEGQPLGSYDFVEKEKTRVFEASRKFPVKFYFGKQNQNVSGNYLNFNKNCLDSFFVTRSEDCEHSLFLTEAKDSILHAMFGAGSELIYSCVTAGKNVYDIKFSSSCAQNVSNLEYCMDCRRGASHLFGCVGISESSYCILNKQYKKDDFFDLVKRIKSHMQSTGEYGKFFPVHLSPFYYNQSSAQDYFPLSKSEAIAQGYTWSDEEVKRVASDFRVPDDISDVDESVLNQTFSCEKSGAAFKFIAKELEFHKKHGIPLPRVAPMERIKSKMNFFNLFGLEKMECRNCKFELLSDLKRFDQPILCEKCFVESL